MATLLPAIAQAFAFWLGVLAVPAGLVAPGAWVGLYVAAGAGAALAAQRRWPRWPAGTWLAALGCTLLLAALFCGANFAMDALHGAQRPKADVASHLGGLELWFVLCPGAASMTIAGLVRAVLAGRRATA